MDYNKKPNFRSSALSRRLESTSPSIMQSLDSISIIEQGRQSEDKCWDGLKEVRPDVTLTGNFMDMHLDGKSGATQSFLLINGEEQLQVQSPEQFSAKLGLLSAEDKVKVVSIFGNTGDGKSYTLNHTFFNGNNVFPTSSAAASCTMGAWASYDPTLKIICLDTEGLLGSTSNENQRTRLLLKVLAISDVVIYRTRAERLHRDLFTFLGSASRAFAQHFQAALQRVALSTTLSALGPALFIFHETKHTRPLIDCSSETPEDFLRKRFAGMKMETDAFSSLRYVGTQSGSGCTDFSGLKRAVKTELENTSVRSARSPAIVFTTLKVLNDRFSGEVDSAQAPLFPDQYFTCPEVCAACKNRCQSSMGHLKDDLPHNSTTRCVYQHQYENYLYLCKKCHSNGVEQIVTPKAVPNSVTPWYGLAKYVWSGYAIECPTCGEIYTSRQYWYGNRAPEDCHSVRTEITHIWPGTRTHSTGPNTAQRVLDGVSFLSETVVGVVAQPTKLIGSYVADQIAPKYWRPNSEISAPWLHQYIIDKKKEISHPCTTSVGPIYLIGAVISYYFGSELNMDALKDCAGCTTPFAPTASKHHCRNCGEGFCEGCSSQTAPVPRHGWLDPVRVCDQCYADLQSQPPPANSEPADVTARRVGEIMVNTISSVATVLDYPKGIIKDSARPTYWVPDADIRSCCVCDGPFDPLRPLHHCRDCGRGVCDPCSTHRRPVPRRGWEKPVRICDACHKAA